MIRVITVHEQAVFRAGLKAILSTTADIKVVFEATLICDAIATLDEFRLDVLVAELYSICCASMDLLRQIKKNHPTLPVVVIGPRNDAEFISLALKAGARGYLTAECSSTEIIEIIRKVATGRAHITEHVAEELVSQYWCNEAPQGHQSLTERELEIFLRIASGQTCTQVARELSRSVKTVSTHKTRIMNKMHLTSHAELVQYAVAHKLIATLGG